MLLALQRAMPMKKSTPRPRRRPAAKGAKRAVAKKAVPKKSAARNAAGKRAATKKPPAKKAAAKKAAAKKVPTAKAAAALAEYNRKRDFSRTGEPAGTVPKARGRALHFVVQKHAASHLHYDFRLELDGVMKSWAVPKGPSYDPAVRRLAMEVEDHPVSYNSFEGTIPAGEYGGGTVMLWDRGTYDAEGGGGAESLRRGYEKGDLKITMHGERLQGGWVLVRMNRPGRPQWLLIKHRDDTADPGLDVTAKHVKSVVTRRTMEQIAKGGRVWHSNR
jgi:bifunctional non-homologous end joining protein LigD